jgi:hypothetical protein
MFHADGIEQEYYFINYRLKVCWLNQKVQIKKKEEGKTIQKLK